MSLDKTVQSLIPLDEFLSQYSRGVEDYDSWCMLRRGMSPQQIGRDRKTLRRWERHPPRSVKGLMILKGMDLYPLRPDSAQLLPFAFLSALCSTEGCIDRVYNMTLNPDSNEDQIFEAFKELGVDAYERHDRINVVGPESRVLSRALVAFGVTQGRKKDSLRIPGGLSECLAAEHPNATKAVQTYLATVLNTQVNTLGKGKEQRYLRLPLQSSRKAACVLAEDFAGLLKEAMGVPISPDDVTARPRTTTLGKGWQPYVYFTADSVEHLRTQHSGLINGRFKSDYYINGR